MSIETRGIDESMAAPSQTTPRFLAAAIDREREQFFLWAPVCLGAGIAAYFAMPAEPSIFVAAVPLLLMLILRAVTVRGTLASVLLTAMILAGTGFLIAKLRAEWVRAPVLTKVMRNVEVTGTVVMVEAKTPRGQRLTIRDPAISGVSAEMTPAVVRIRTMSSRVLASPGDRIRIKANLSPPARPALPGGFDYARTAWFDSIGAVGYAFAAPAIEAHAETGSLSEWYRRSIENIRQSIAVKIRAVLPDESGEIALALITGERGGISAETNDAFKNSGLFHILSISGLHMVIAAGAVFYSLRLMLAAIPRVALTLPIKKIAAAGGILSSIGYLAISGGAFATVRSALMILIIFGAVLIDRPALALRNVALAAFLILVVFPESLLDAGFQMSFAAVTALIASHELLRRFAGTRARPNPVLRLGGFFAGIVASTLIASFAVAPFAAYNFHQSQQYAVLANMIAIPICNLLVMPAALVAMFLMPLGLEGLGLVPMGWGIQGMTWCANYVGALPGAVGHLPEISLASFALMVAGGMWLALWRTRLRLLGVGIAVIGVMIAPWMRRPDIFVAQKGTLVAVRDASGSLSALPVKNAKYDLERWLEYDGDSRSAAEVQKMSAFTCDSVGCTARVKGATIAVARHPAAVPDDCLNADVLILATPKPAECAVPATVIDVFDRWRNGAYALYLDQESNNPEVRVRFETVAARRGVRPWSPTPERSAVHRARLKPAGAASSNTLPVPNIANGPGSKTSKTEAVSGNAGAPSDARSPPPSAGHYDDPGEAEHDADEGEFQ
ncbi:competence protein ComEC [Hyphomicrobium methylovorum]|uniref:ComEC/Rec2 family competence protein n=1 Tax=Hyphomicrobium methylovorum TaxID=84 RepID=UPI0015E65F09|nr:ComEC/Rec2 family competence protein [Hyphomicrobium methylovorum]MBA2125111.1 competence protein ComEC [Hyphomicrobium methylovorum]